MAFPPRTRSRQGEGGPSSSWNRNWAFAMHVCTGEPAVWRASNALGPHEGGCGSGRHSEVTSVTASSTCPWPFVARLRQRGERLDPATPEKTAGQTRNTVADKLEFAFDDTAQVVRDLQVGH
jgi:hypothetical protein